MVISHEFLLLMIKELQVLESSEHIPSFLKEPISKDILELQKEAEKPLHYHTIHFSVPKNTFIDVSFANDYLINLPKRIGNTDDNNNSN